MEKLIPIIIPSYEPDDRFLTLLADLQQKQIGQVVVVNDGSSEKYDHFFTAAEQQYNAIVLRHEVNKGKGKALKTAFSFCLEHYHELAGCITADSDGQHATASISEMKQALTDNEQALIIGVRDFSGADVPAKSQFGNNLTRKVFRALYKKDVSDTQTGLRAIPSGFMKDLLSVPGDRFEFETRMLIRALEQGVEIVELPIETIYDSKENHSTHFRPIVDSIRIYRVFGFAFGKFILSSFSSSLVDLGIFHGLCLLLKQGAEGARYVAVATVVARIVSAIYNYSINYYFVFKSKEKHVKTAVKYFLLAAIQMLCSAALTTALIALTGVPVELTIKIPVDLALFLISYQVQKKFIY